MLVPLLLLCFAADLTPDTVSRLKVAWTYSTHATPPNKRAERIAAFEATPVLSGGLLYVITPFNQVTQWSHCALRREKLVWHFQVVHHDLWDYDVASRPASIEVNGKPAVGVLTKLGHYFALDRVTGKPLLPVEERAVPRSDVEGESATPSQPFPSGGVFTEQKFTPRAGWCADEFRKLRYEGIFTPPSVGGTLVFPGNVGGADWGSGAYDAASWLWLPIGLRPRSA